MKSNYIFELLLDNAKLFEELSNLTEEDIEFLKKRVMSIDERMIYSFEFHGIYHSQKVFLFGFLLGKKIGLSDEDSKILYDALILHDCGRINEFEESFHGYAGAMKLQKLFKNDEFYKRNNNLDILCAIVDAHSADDSYSERIALNYELDESSLDRFQILCQALKDADALDRARFPKSNPASIKQKFLRFDYSKSLIEFAYKVNAFYADCINKIYFEKYSKKYLTESKQEDCIHSIGWDFSKFEGIIDHGILSEYSASKKEIKLSRNFKGNNSKMWISVVDGKDISLKGKCFETFLMNGICFYAVVSKLNSGEEIESKANSEGLPKKSNEYDDESFAFYEIPLEDILAIVFPGDSYKSSLRELNYLGCANSFSVVSDRVDKYASYIEKATGIRFSKNIVEKKIKQLMELQLSFGNKNEAYQRSNLKNFIESTEQITSSINTDICNWMDIGFKSYFGLQYDESPTVEMVIKNILAKKIVDYEVIEGESFEDGTTIVVNFSKEKEDNKVMIKKQLN